MKFTFETWTNNEYYYNITLSTWTALSGFKLKLEYLVWNITWTALSGFKLRLKYLVWNITWTALSGFKLKLEYLVWNITLEPFWWQTHKLFVVLCYTLLTVFPRKNIWFFHLNFF